MAELKDSGARRNFGTGAVRDVAEGKGRCDLLPLGVIALYSDEPIFARIEDYIRHGECDNLWRAIELFSKKHDWKFSTVLLEVSKQYEDGCQKYGDRNWENGIPLHCYIDSGVRHYLKFLRGDADEPHDRAFIWNMLGAIWTHENKPELIDLPFAKQDKSEMGNPVTETEPIKIINYAKYSWLSTEELSGIVCDRSEDCKSCILADKCADREYAESDRQTMIEFLEQSEPYGLEREE